MKQEKIFWTDTFRGTDYDSAEDSPIVRGMDDILLCLVMWRWNGDIGGILYVVNFTGSWAGNDVSSSRINLKDVMQ